MTLRDAFPKHEIHRIVEGKAALVNVLDNHKFFLNFCQNNDDILFKITRAKSNIKLM